jgi:hypothetical protein
LKLQFVAGKVNIVDQNVCTCDVLGIVQNVMSVLGLIPEAGGIFIIVGAVIGLIESSGGSGFDPVETAYVNLRSANLPGPAICDPHNLDPNAMLTSVICNSCYNRRQQ